MNSVKVGNSGVMFCEVSHSNRVVGSNFSSTMCTNQSSQFFTGRPSEVKERIAWFTTLIRRLSSLAERFVTAGHDYSARMCVFSSTFWLS